MSKRFKKLDSKQHPKQRTFAFSFEERVTTHLAEKQVLLEDAGKVPQGAHAMESFDEACVELAAAIKRAVRHYGKGRKALVNEINTYFGWRDDGGRSPLSIHMLNHYLSKPVEYPISAAMLFAIQHITGSLEPCRLLAEAEGGEVISAEDKQHLMLGKMEAAVWEMNRLKRQLKNGNGK